MIKKSDCIAACDLKDIKDFKSLCDNIDERLKKYDRSAIIVFIPEYISDKVIDRLVEDYSVYGGWIVNKNYDHINGSWLKFE